MGTAWPQDRAPQGLHPVRLTAWAATADGCIGVWLGLALAALDLA